MTPNESIEAIYSGFNRGNIPFILDQLAIDVVWRQPASVPWGGEYNGPAGADAFFTKLDELVETTGFEVEENIEAGGLHKFVQFREESISPCGSVVS